MDFSKSEITKLRNRDLISQATAIRDLATTALSETGAAGRGVTAARVAILTAAITAFENLLNQPRSQIVNRSTLLKEVETDTAALLDDLALQLAGTEVGDRFIQAWKKARIIVDAGHRPGEDEEPASPPPAPPAP